MALKAVRTVVTLDPDDLMRLQRILMDGDKDEAFSFVQDVIGEKVRCAQTETHKPEFEGGIRPDRAHHPAPTEHDSNAGESG
jgi:hypothetical protein